MATLKKVTRKLSGRSKDRFFDAGLSPDAAKAAVTSLRVRKDLWPVSKELAPRTPRAGPAVERLPAGPAEAPSQPASAALPKHEAALAEEGFDAYQFGLVPVFKREGSEGLTRRLAGIEDVEALRTMAKSQQIVLPKEIRRGEVTAEDVRKAILEAVEQRVSDRKVQL